MSNKRNKLLDNLSNIWSKEEKELRAAYLKSQPNNFIEHQDQYLQGLNKAEYSRTSKQ